MTQHPPGHPPPQHPQDSPLPTRHQEEAVRRRLAAARHDEPIPQVVAERLDRVLTGLATEGAHSPGNVPVVDLAARRRRRHATQLLVAAAAVVAVGFGVNELVGNTSSSDKASSGADSPQFERDGSADFGNKASGGTDEPAPAAVPEDLAALPVVRPQTLRGDVLRARKQTIARSEVADLAGRAACRDTAAGERAVAVSFNDRLATLVFHAPQGDRQRVDLYRCDPPGLIRSIVVPRP